MELAATGGSASGGSEADERWSGGPFCEGPSKNSSTRGIGEATVAAGPSDCLYSKWDDLLEALSFQVASRSCRIASYRSRKLSGGSQIQM